MDTIDIDQALQDTIDLDGKVDFTPRIPVGEDKYMPVIPNGWDVPKQVEPAPAPAPAPPKVKAYTYESALTAGLPEKVARWYQQKLDYVRSLPPLKPIDTAIRGIDDSVAPKIPVPVITNPTRIPIVPQVVRHKKDQVDKRKYSDRSGRAEYMKKYRAYQKKIV